MIKSFFNVLVSNLNFDQKPGVQIRPGTIFKLGFFSLFGYVSETKPLGKIMFWVQTGSFTIANTCWKAVLTGFHHEKFYTI